MQWDEKRLLAAEVDAIHGLLPGSGGPPVLRDPTVLAVWAWSPRARLLALGTGAARKGRAGTAAIDGGPSWVFPAHVDVPPAPLPVVVSTVEGRRAAQRFVRPDTWQPDEWGELIGGRLGEWAMAVHGRAPVSICHTPAASATAAEAGIWTRPDFRGRGLAPACVAAWSHRERRNKEVLFYSTTDTNLASQSVARRLGLRRLGWIWTAR
ncbi:GNAT family N-acetyltransferase [Streptomyces sp. NPDC047071]|uniref:GNAT family N-acetyltransferase n=1 Tax=Streptomyces sp. NPDC047071 TaxID=3154808 RepID=UPI0034543353